MYVESPKPRTTALNFILYQLLDTESRDQDKHYSERKKVIGKLARDLVISFVSSVQDQETQKKDPKVVHPDMTYIRKFTIESVTKAMKSVTKSPKSLETNVGKLYGWLNLISSFLITDRSYLHSVLDSNKTYVDKYQIGKLMLDMNVPSIIAECLAALDLNYPFAKRLFNKGIEPLNAVNEIRSRFSDLFKLENTEEDDEVEDDSEKEENSDMFKNSALGMYDVEDIEDDEDDDASLIGEDEDIAFVEGDDGEIEVVFSEDEHDHHDESIGSHDMNESDHLEDSDQMMDYDNDDDLDSEQSSSSSEIHGAHSGSESDDSSYYTDNEDRMSEDGARPVITVNLNSSEIDESDWESRLSDISNSDWESGLSDLSPSEYDSSEEDFQDGTNAGSRWLADEVHDDDESDDDDRGVFTGIQHVFSPEPQYFRVHGHNNGNHGSQHRHGNRRADYMMATPMSLSNGSRGTRGILMNPLGPSGLEEVENGILNHLNSSNNRPRNDSLNLSDILFNGEFFDEKSSLGIVLKSTTARWSDIFDMFYDSKVYANNVIPTIIGRIFQPSSELYVMRREEALAKERAEKMRREENIKKQTEFKKRKLA